MLLGAGVMQLPAWMRVDSVDMTSVSEQKSPLRSLKGKHCADGKRVGYATKTVRHTGNAAWGRAIYRRKNVRLLVAAYAQRPFDAQAVWGVGRGADLETVVDVVKVLALGERCAITKLVQVRGDSAITPSRWFPSRRQRVVKDKTQGDRGMLKYNPQGARVVEIV